MHITTGKAWVFLIFAAALTAPAGAAPATLTLDDAVKAAAQNNLALQRTAWDLDAKARQNDKAWNVFLPSASASAALSRSNPATNSITGASVPGSVNAQGALSLSLRITGNVFASLEAVALNYRSGLVTYDLARKGLEKNVRTLYYSLLLEEENLKITQDSLDRAAKNLAKVQASYKAGLVPDLDVLTAQVTLEQLKPQLQQLQSSHLNNLGQLKVLLGLPLDQDIVLVGTLGAAVESHLNLTGAQADLQVSPDVQKAQLNVDAQELNKKSLDLNSWIPTLSLGWSASPTNVDLFQDIYNGSSAQYPKAKNGWQDNGTLSLSLSYSFDSIIPWTQGRETILQAEDSVRKAHSQLEETRVNSDLTRQNLVRSIDQALQSLVSLDLAVQLAQKTYDLSLDSYSRGGKDLLAVQSA
ncbi:MAG TPA: TolC family protein, partial [Spirochaetia bacterium]|nr:TolC family protein [Spirochaetia bacterium]